MGGSTAGYSLAKFGYKVLFVEYGDFPEFNSSNTQSRSGYWPDQLRLSYFGKIKDLFVPIGCGPGGSTKLYAAQLERMHPKDFNPDESQGNQWPISYVQFCTYYSQAEGLFRVSGTSDSHNPVENLIKPPPLSASDQKIFSEFQKIGLNPFRSHVALDFKENCNGCGGIICQKHCKNDAEKICLTPAIKQCGAHLLTNCKAQKINANQVEVTSIDCDYMGRQITLKSKFYILATGALFTPELLLKSKNTDWPNGIANSSDMVGRNLMFHLSDFYAIKPKRGANKSKPSKSISTNALYELEKQKLGTFQSVGIPINQEYFLKFLISIRGRISGAQIIPDLILWIVAKTLALLFQKYTIFASIIEDFPEVENRVLIDSNGATTIQYTISPNTAARNNLFKKNMMSLLKSSFSVINTNNKFNVNLGHAMGTCRFGLNPKTSVTNLYNQCHDLKNLYICDSSFFPSSSGVNPSLTIAANSLRVAEHIAKNSEFKIC